MLGYKIKHNFILAHFILIMENTIDDFENYLHQHEIGNQTIVPQSIQHSGSS